MKIEQVFSTIETIVQETYIFTFLMKRKEKFNICMSILKTTKNVK